MDKKEYLNSIKIQNDTRIGELNMSLKSLGEAIAQSEKDLAFYNQQGLDIEKEIAKLGTDNIMLDEIITIIPNND